MTFETFKELTKESYPEIFELLKKVKLERVPLYGPLYNSTYNQQDVLTHLQDFLDVMDVHKPKTCLETFSGNAKESNELAKRYRRTQFHAVDYSDYYKKFSQRNLTYHQANCFERKTLGKFDFVFIGSLNASGCCIDSIANWYKYFDFCNANVKDGGLMGLSFFDDPISCVDSFHTTNTTIIAEHGIYKGCTVKWLTVNRKKLFDNSHTYYDLAIILKGGKPIRAMVNLKGEKFYSTNTGSIFSIAKQKGFELIPERFSEPFALFRKTT